MRPPLPADEATRLATLRSLLILDTPPEERFDTITAYAASLFKVSIALVSLVDSDRQWFKSSHGLASCETSRDISFCAHAILQDGIFEVTDAVSDVRFADNPLVNGYPRVRFYAGCPLRMQNGQQVGTLCLLDPIPRRLDAWERDHLALLGKLVEAELQGLPPPAEAAGIQLGQPARPA